MIILTDQDADFIEKKAREVLEQFDKNNETAKITEQLFAELFDIKLDEKDKKEISKAYEEQQQSKKEWERVVALMTL